MINDITKVVDGYTTGMKQSKEVKRQAEAYIKENYMPDSAVFDEAMKACTSTFDEAVQPLKKSYGEAVEKEFTEARKRIAEVVGTAVPPEVVNLLPMVDNMTDFEKQSVLEKYSHNYMASKMLNQAMHNQDFKTVEHLIEDLDSLEGQLNKVTNQGLDCYETKLMEKGDWINRVSEDTEAFIDRYSMKGGEE